MSHRVGSVLVLGVIVTSSLLLTACPPTPPPSATYQIEIRSKGNLLFGTSRNSPPFNATFGPVSLLTVPTTSLKPTNDVRAFLAQATDLDANNLSQLAVYARNPTEMRTAFDSIFDPNVWRDEANCAKLPAVLMATATPTFGPWEGTVAATTSEYFPKGCTPPGGPAADPDGLSSVKAIQLSREGACRAFVNYGRFKTPAGCFSDGIFSEIQDGLSQTYSASIAGGKCADGFVDALDLVSFMDLNLPSADAPGTDPQSGFFLNMNLHAHLYIPKHDPYVRAQVRYNIQQAGGRFTLSPTVNELTTSGYQNAQNAASLSTALNTTLPDRVFQESDNAQAIAPADEPADKSQLRFCTTDAECGPSEGCLNSRTSGAGGCGSKKTCQRYQFLSCSPETDPLTGQPTERITKDGPHDCSFAIGLMEQAIHDGAQALGFTPADQQHLVSVASSGGAHFDNWRCKQPTRGAADSTEHFRCEYVLNAKRLDRHPDGFDLVWFDWFDERELDNEAFAAFVGLRGFEIIRNAPASSLTSKLCSHRPDEDAIRGYSNATMGPTKTVTAAFTDAPSCILNQFIVPWLLSGFHAFVPVN